MSSNTNQARNWFEQGGRAYARFRPAYPLQLAAFLASVAPDKRLAVDVGCGNGQLTQLFAPYFSAVVGLDPSTDQIANTIPCKPITFQCAPAEQLQLPARKTVVEGKGVSVRVTPVGPVNIQKK